MSSLSVYKPTFIPVEISLFTLQKVTHLHWGLACAHLLSHTCMMLIFCLSAKSHGVSISHVRKASLGIIISIMRESHHCGESAILRDYGRVSTSTLLCGYNNSRPSRTFYLWSFLQKMYSEIYEYFKFSTFQHMNTRMSAYTDMYVICWCNVTVWAYYDCFYILTSIMNLEPCRHRINHAISVEIFCHLKGARISHSFVYLNEPESPLILR